MSLRYVREMSFQLLYQFEFQSDHIEAQSAAFLDLAQAGELAMQQLYDIKWDVAEQAESVRIAQAVNAKKQELDAVYEPHLIGWKISRLPKIDKVILRLAVYELLYRREVPVSVVLNEAVELIKSYSDLKSKAYVNAVLGNVVKAHIKKIAQLRAIPEEEITNTLSYKYAENEEA